MIFQGTVSKSDTVGPGPGPGGRLRRSNSLAVEPMVRQAESDCQCHAGTWRPSRSAPAGAAGGQPGRPEPGSLAGPGPRAWPGPGGQRSQLLTPVAALAVHHGVSGHESLQSCDPAAITVPLTRTRSFLSPSLRPCGRARRRAWPTGPGRALLRPAESLAEQAASIRVCDTVTPSPFQKPIENDAYSAK